MSSFLRRAVLVFAAGLFAAHLGSHGRPAAAQMPPIDDRSTPDPTPDPTPDSTPDSMSGPASAAPDFAPTAPVLPWPAGAAIVVGDKKAVWLVDASGMRRLAPATHAPSGMVVGFPHPDGLVLRESMVAYSQGDGLRLARWDGGGTSILVDPRAMPRSDVPARYRHARGIRSMSVGRGTDVWFTTTALSDREDQIGFLEERELDDLWRVATTGGAPVRVLAPGAGGAPVVAPDGSHVAVLRAAKRRYGPAWLGRLSLLFRSTWRCAGSGAIRLVDPATGRWNDVLDVPCVDSGTDAGWSAAPSMAWSPDGGSLHVAVATTPGQAEDAGPVRIVDIDATTGREISSRTVGCVVSGMRFLSSGEWFICRSRQPGNACLISKVADSVTWPLPGCRLHAWNGEEAQLILGGKTVNDPVVVMSVDGTRLAEGTYDELGNCDWLTSDLLICREGSESYYSLELRDLQGATQGIAGLLHVEMNVQWYTKVDPSMLP